MTPKERANNLPFCDHIWRTFCTDCVAAAIFAAVAEERERCAKCVDAEEELPGLPSQEMMLAMVADPVGSMRALVRVTKRNIAAAIREGTDEKEAR